MTAPWPQDQTDTLICLWKGGSSSGEIARQLGITFGLNCTRNMVMGKVNRLRLKRSRAVKTTSCSGNGATDSRWAVSKPVEKRSPSSVTIKAQVQTAISRPVPFIEINHTTCKWPLWNGGKTGNCCGARPVPAAPYCPYHYEKAFTGLWSRRRTTA